MLLTEHPCQRPAHLQRGVQHGGDAERCKVAVRELTGARVTARIICRDDFILRHGAEIGGVITTL